MLRRLHDRRRHLPALAAATRTAAAIIAQPGGIPMTRHGTVFSSARDHALRGAIPCGPVTAEGVRQRSPRAFSLVSATSTLPQWQGHDRHAAPSGSKRTLPCTTVRRRFHRPSTGIPGFVLPRLSYASRRSKLFRKAVWQLSAARRQRAELCCRSQQHRTFLIKSGWLP